MKYILLSIVLSFSASESFSQDLNKRLYEAVVAKDTVVTGKLLNEGADANYKVRSGFFEMSLLIWAVQKQDLPTVKLLADHKADVNFKDAFKTTPLMYAATTGNKEIVSYLISKGADIHARDDQGNTVLTAAKESKNADVIALVEDLLKKEKK